MAIRRRVTATGKDNDGDIACLCNASSIWSPVKSVTAIREIESKAVEYYVEDIYGRHADVHVVNGPTKKYLRTDPNSNCQDNLDNLPDCSCY